MNRMTRNLDIILLGATGFTGKHTVPVISKLAKLKNLTWGIAGRSEEKLKNVLEQTEKATGFSLAHIPIFIANIENENSLKEMAREARIVINCCGPYRFFGEPVVKACIEEGTHHVDVSGEPQYMEEMQLKYHEKAQQKGVYIISACGVDCIPTDLGIVFLGKKFKGTLNSVETYLETKTEGPEAGGPVFTLTTWESAIYGIAHAKELQVLRRKLFEKRLPKLKPKLEFKGKPHKNNLVEGWILPFPGADRSVLKRSQRLFYEKENKRPIQIETYFIMKSYWSVAKLAAFGFMFQKMATSKRGRDLLLKYPEKFSGGTFSRELPKEETIQNTHFCLTLYGEGWKENLSGDEECTFPPNKAMCVKVKGTNPGYGATCTCVVLAAITVITETEKLPPGGGVYPPGFAFANTSLIEQLNENEVTFEVAFEKNLPTAKY